MLLKQTWSGHLLHEVELQVELQAVALDLVAGVARHVLLATDAEALILVHHADVLLDVHGAREAAGVPHVELPRGPVRVLTALEGARCLPGVDVRPERLRRFAARLAVTRGAVDTCRVD